MNYQINKQYIIWFARQNPEIQNLIIKNLKNEYFKEKSKNGDYKNIEIISLINSIEGVKNQIESKNCKNNTNNIDNIRSNKLKIIANQKVRTNKKSEQLLNYKSLLIDLVEANYSSRSICIYLIKYHRYSVSHTTINAFINWGVQSLKSDLQGHHLDYLYF